MFEYLINYGIKANEVNYEDVDINDRLHLEEQINMVRKNYHSLLTLVDEINDSILQCSRKMSQLTKELMLKNEGTSVNRLLSSDEKYIEYEAKLQALKVGLNSANNLIDYCKNDLRVLNSVFYNKF